MSSGSTCKICMQPRDLNEEGLCEPCNLWNDSMDGTVLALVESGKYTGITE